MENLESLLGPPGNWRHTAFSMIKQIPPGHVASYGYVADRVNAHGHSVSARNIAWLRHKLYEELGHETIVPLHRLAKSGDIHSLADSEETRAINDRLRRNEGFFDNPRFLDRERG